MAENHRSPEASRLRKASNPRKPKSVAPVQPESSGNHPSSIDGGGEAGRLIAKLRKPIAPPTRVAEDERKYSRARMRERSRREDLEH